MESAPASIPPTTLVAFATAMAESTLNPLRKVVENY